MPTKPTDNMTTSQKAGYRKMIGYIQPSAVARLDLGTPETIFPVRSASGSVPVYIDPTCTAGLTGEQAEAASQNSRVPRHIKVVVYANEIWSGGAKLAVATTDAIAREIAEALNVR
ncbi:hypothetical protein SD235_13680 [Burkholderia cepacia]|uniref:hypothetical protein n=1 Tax=Burkholderia cepacia TaxID=292 RepID=UPI003A4D9E01